jgi:hypothetical protein
MRILFITLIDDVKNASLGFIVKDISKAEALNTVKDTSCLAISFSANIASDYQYHNFVQIKKKEKVAYSRFFQDFKNEAALCKQIEGVLDSEKFDVVLFRYNIASRSLYKLVEKFPKKFVFEHNTFEETEHALLINERFKRLPFSLKPGYLIYKFTGKWWPLFCEKHYGNKIRQLALGGISVTKEIANYQMRRIPTYKNTVVTNGVKYPLTQSLPNKIVASETLKLFMLLGTGANWHGVDRLIHGLKNYTGLQKITIDIIGYYNHSDKALVDSLELHEQIRFLEPVPNENLEVILNNYNISIGTLALHRKKLIEATPLKTRESLLRGFPIIMAYHDSDISQAKDLEDVFLNLPANETPIDFNLVAAFYTKLLTQGFTSQQISDKAKPYIDYNVKAEQMVEFMKKQVSHS